ncbi:MAG TPA: IS30 family transposase [Myxococcaceae bacterium]|nr:IS30 family transposase [Myxococcaceae bacterium]
MPSHLLAQPSGHYLSFAEREEIFAGVERGESIRSMARRLGRAPSTVLRELRRNMPHQYRTRSQLKPGADLGRPRTQPWDYRPSLAQRRADQRAARPKPARLAQEGRLREEVQERLEDKMSPEQIVAHLRHQFDDPGMWVSHETIYQSIYVQGRGALRRQLASCLRTGRALRQPQRRSNQRRPRTPNMINISERPAEVQDRALPGHWEGDLIMGKGNRSAIGTLVERSTRFVMLLHLPNGHQAEAVQEAMIAATQRLPQTLWKSLTWDQGVEMSNHAQISAATDLDIYFCDPHSPWQRGSNENTNGLLRQYFPKGTDLSVHSLEHLRFVEAQMNRRIRKTLNWLSPAQALDRLLSTTSHPPGVATTT